MSVGHRIRNLRMARGISAEKLASVIGVSRSTMYRYENGDIEKLPGDVLGPISAALGTTPAYLMGWESDPEEQSEPAVLDGKPLDEQDLKLLRLLRTMTPEEKDWLLDRIDAFLALR